MILITLGASVAELVNMLFCGLEGLQFRISLQTIEKIVHFIFGSFSCHIDIAMLSARLFHCLFVPLS
jgi:hypothetical protein